MNIIVFKKIICQTLELAHSYTCSRYTPNTIKILVNYVILKFLKIKNYIDLNLAYLEHRVCINPYNEPG